MTLAFLRLLVNQYYEESLRMDDIFLKNTSLASFLLEMLRVLK